MSAKLTVVPDPLPPIPVNEEARADLEEEAKRLEREAKEASESAKSIRALITKLDGRETLSEDARKVMEAALQVARLRREMEQAIVDGTGARRPS